jgi:hypothetical protein
MMNELQARLHSLYASRVQLAQVGPQMAGLERYRIIASGEQLYTLLEAADRIAELEAALRKITATTYGSELSMSPEEHNEYFAQFYRQYRDIARAALAGSSPPGDATVDRVFFCQNAGYICERCRQHKYKHVGSMLLCPCLPPSDATVDRGGEHG